MRYRRPDARRGTTNLPARRSRCSIRVPDLFCCLQECPKLHQTLSVSLQRRSMDICSAMQEVKHVIKALDRVRDEIDTNRSSWYKEAAAMGEAVDAEPPKLPRTNNRQRHRANVPASNPEEYYQRAVTIYFLDHLLSEMKAFPQHKKQLSLPLLSSHLSWHLTRIGRRKP